MATRYLREDEHALSRYLLKVREFLEGRGVGRWGKCGMGIKEGT